MTQKEWLERYYGCLVGGTIVGVRLITEDREPWRGTQDGHPWPELEVQYPGKNIPTRRVEVSCDEEGNGPGFLFGLDDPNQVDKQASRDVDEEEPCQT